MTLFGRNMMGCGSDKSSPICLSLLLVASNAVVSRAELEDHTNRSNRTVTQD